MNTGTGDAINLAWKLQPVLTGRASEALLDSYEPERIKFVSCRYPQALARARGVVRSLLRRRNARIATAWLLARGRMCPCQLSQRKKTIARQRRDSCTNSAQPGPAILQGRGALHARRNCRDCRPMRLCCLWLCGGPQFQATSTAEDRVCATTDDRR
jgi:hypothetical protein